MSPPGPAGEPIGTVEFIGGTLLATSPQISYRRLLEALAVRGLAIRAWSYVPGFDHQSQATEAWRAFRRGRQASPAEQPLLRLGHSLGCKLHLLAPDGGRGCSGLVAMCFNNFSADRSIPLLADLAPRLGVRTEFSPSPQETLRLVGLHYRQPRNLLLRFGNDALDQSRRLIGVLQQRPDDASTLVERPGDHLTPASAGLRQNLLGAWADDPARQRQIDRLADQLLDWWGHVPNLNKFPGTG
ncbi:alpha/beta hydrolase [Synechococcus sp. SynAce01]|nr:alpha/beta hydrolase [Synechococcus sp. SynAce01]